MHTVERESLLGTWLLESVAIIDGDGVVNAHAFGENPFGAIHYLPDGRMSVLIAHAGRPPLAGGRHGASDAASLAAAKTFIAYAGTFSVEEDRVIHHIDINNFPNDVGADYVRVARLDGDRLELATPPDLPADQRPMRLVWRRYVARA